MDRSKNTVLIPPGFGTPTSYLPGSGEYLTPNLVPGALSGGLVAEVGSVNYPSVDAASIGGYPVMDTSISSMTASASFEERVHEKAKRDRPGSGSNYVKLRDIGQAVDFGVTYDSATNTVRISLENPMKRR